MPNNNNSQQSALTANEQFHHKYSGLTLRLIKGLTTHAEIIAAFEVIFQLVQLSDGNSEKEQRWLADLSVAETRPSSLRTLLGELIARYFATLSPAEQQKIAFQCMITWQTNAKDNESEALWGLAIKDCAIFMLLRGISIGKVFVR